MRKREVVVGGVVIKRKVGLEVDKGVRRGNDG